MIERHPRTDILAEASRLIDAAEAAGVPIRLIGGVAVRLHVPPGETPVVQREYKDIDLVTLKGKSRQVSEFMDFMGYERDGPFNTVNGARRLLFYDSSNARQVDVFVGSFEMCHDIPITERIELATHGIPLAELFLTKMQVIELNEKDRLDIVTMLYHHDVADHDVSSINAERIAELCAADWGLWRTTQLNVERVREGVPYSDLDDHQQQTVLDRLGRVWERVEQEPKPVKWRLRNRVGDKKRWYEEPEEVG
jgi:hypothetical protein